MSAHGILSCAQAERSRDALAAELAHVSKDLRNERGIARTWKDIGSRLRVRATKAEAELARVSSERDEAQRLQALEARATSEVRERLIAVSRERDDLQELADERLDAIDQWTKADKRVRELERELADERELSEVLTRHAEDVLREHETMRNAIEAALRDENVTYSMSYGGSLTPMMVERLAIVRALGYEDESAWLAAGSRVEERCPRCHGTGDDSHRDGPCSTCQGSGSGSRVEDNQ